MAAQDILLQIDSFNLMNQLKQVPSTLLALAYATMALLLLAIRRNSGNAGAVTFRICTISRLVLNVSQFKSSLSISFTVK